MGMGWPVGSDKWKAPKEKNTSGTARFEPRPPDRKCVALLSRQELFKKWIQLFIEWFSFECRKTKTKVITLANHIGHRQYIEPIKTRSNYMWLTQSAGKCMRARHNWLWFYF